MTMINTRKKRRAKTLRRVTTGVAAGTAVGLAVAGVAVAANRTERVIPKLPAPGATTEAELLSKGIELVVAGRKIRTGPLQGRAAFEIEANQTDPSAVRTRIKAFHLATTSLREGITVTVDLEQRTGIRHVASRLRRVSADSPRFQHTLALPCIITIANTQALGLPAGIDEPLALAATVPVELSGKPSGFPDDRAQYKLNERIELTASGLPLGYKASIVKFPLQVKGL
ncbi:hypothetical protein O1R50_15105 [Glycomyces luteolus]|uniref:Uncharacterized protein n=1 Tax=Glycomyces luteolus TaxID=2670330 RepID=A0A9X3SU46_9ACTN|nr:hypothetical protein [Glycomyces luteolus]MDA1360958.1 hypothetical protein [Glycomyces luteolus]